jgi:hypothetical protein
VDAAALEEAHSKGVLHPRARPSCSISDWQVAPALAGEAETATIGGSILGTPAYMGTRTATVLSAVLRDDPARLNAPVKTRCAGQISKPPNQQPLIAVLPFANMSGDHGDKITKNISAAIWPKKSSTR